MYMNMYTAVHVNIFTWGQENKYNWDNIPLIPMSDTFLLALIKTHCYFFLRGKKFSQGLLEPRRREYF